MGRPKKYPDELVQRGVRLALEDRKPGGSDIVRFVSDELQKTSVKGGILGSFRFDRHGDITPVSIPIFRVTGRTPAEAGVFTVFRGAVVDRVVKVPARLAG